MFLRRVCVRTQGVRMCFLLAVRGGVPFPVCPWGQLRLPAASRRGPASVLPSLTRFPATAQRHPPPPAPSLQRRAGAWRPVVRTRPSLRLPVALRPPSRVSGGRGTSSVATTPLGFVLSSRVEFIQKWKEVTPSKMFIFCNS